MLRKMFDVSWAMKLHTTMSFRATTLRQCGFLVILLGLFAGPRAFGQAATSPIAFANQDAIVTSFVTMPQLGAGGDLGAAGDNTQWLKVEFHYGATALATNPYVDSVQFKIWIEGLDPIAPNTSQASGKGVAVALTGQVTYVNIPASKDIYGVFYVHPNTLGRYSEHGYTDFDRKYDIHMEAYVNGALMDKIDKNKETDPNWFKALRATPDLVYRQDQSPFVVLDVSKYPAIKLQPDTAQ
jgi:hypothetical protein